MALGEATERANTQVGIQLQVAGMPEACQETGAGIDAVSSKSLPGRLLTDQHAFQNRN